MDGIRKINSPKFRLGIFAIILSSGVMVFPSTAQAETIYLKCGQMDLLAIDLTNNTVNGHPASISPIAIDWTLANQYGENHLHIDRVAGTLSSSGVYHMPKGDVPIPYSAPDACAAQSAPATKF